MVEQRYLDDIQKAYVAFYGRPADPAGQLYWAEYLQDNHGDLSAVIEAFGSSAESKTLYGSGSTSEAIDKIYQQLFNRNADEAGKQWWVEEIDAGRVSLQSAALDIMNGAKDGDVTAEGDTVLDLDDMIVPDSGDLPINDNSSDDFTLVSSKIEAANHFTSNLGLTAISYHGEQDLATARDYLSKVGQEREERISFQDQLKPYPPEMEDAIASIAATKLPTIPLPGEFDDTQNDASEFSHKANFISDDAHVNGVLGLRYRDEDSGQAYSDSHDQFLFVAQKDGTLNFDYNGHDGNEITVSSKGGTLMYDIVPLAEGASDYHYSGSATVFAGESVAIDITGGYVNEAGEGNYYSFDLSIA